MQQGYENYREFIPYGACNPESTPDVQAAQLFHDIDKGTRLGERQLEVARKICGSCIQFPYCNDDQQRERIAVELWRRGVQAPFIGGYWARAAPGVSELVAPPMLEFDLTMIPELPQLALNALRQGVRVGQLSTMGQTASGIKIISHRFMGKLEKHNPAFYSSLEAGMGKADSAQAAELITRIFFQQEKFKEFVAKRRMEHYDPAIFDLETNYDAMRLFMEDALAVKRAGLRRPAAWAIRHSATYFNELMNQVAPPELRSGKKHDKSYSMLLQVIEAQPNEPAEALTAYMARLHSVREVSDLPESYARRIALSKGATEKALSHTGATNGTSSQKLVRRLKLLGTGGESVEEVMDDIDATTAFVRREYGGKELPAGVRMQDLEKIARLHKYDYLERIPRFIADVESLAEEFDGRPGVTDAVLRRFAMAAEPRETAVAFFSRLAHFKNLKAEAGNTTVPDSFLAEYALRTDAETFEAIRLAYTEKKLQTRFRARASREGVARLQPWMIQRILVSYEDDELDDVANNVYELLKRGILVVSRAEIPELLANTLHHGLEDACSPYTREHLTFAAPLAALDELSRVALAYDFNIVKVVYGNTLTGLEEHIVPGDGIDRVLPRVDGLLEKTQEGGIALSVLNNDITEMLYAYPVLRPLHLNSRMSVVGAQNVPLVAEKRKSGLLFENEVYHWLHAYVVANVPPTHQAQERTWDLVNGLLANGTLQVEGEPGLGYRLSFSDKFMAPHITETDRAVIAHAAKVDMLLYGQDVGEVLKARLDIEDFFAYAHQVMEKVTRPPVKTELQTETPVAARQQEVALASPSEEIIVPDLEKTAQHPASFPIKQPKNYQLLTAEGEVELAKMIEVGVLAQERLETFAHQSPSVDELAGDTLEEYEEDLRILAQRGVQAKEDFLHSNVRLAKSVVWQIISQYPSSYGLADHSEDLVNEALMGMMESIEKFDYAQGNKFSTYAYFYIRRAVLRAIPRVIGNIYISPDRHRHMRIFKVIRARLRRETGQVPSNEEIAKEMGMKVAAVENVAEAVRLHDRSYSLNMPIESGEGDSVEFGELLANKQPGPEEVVLAGLTKDDLLRIPNTMRRPVSPGQVIIAYFGFEGGERYTLEQISQLFGASYESVRKAYHEGINYLRGVGYGKVTE